MTFQNQTVFKRIATSNLSDENINFESDRTSWKDQCWKNTNKTILAMSKSFEQPADT